MSFTSRMVRRFSKFLDVRVIYLMDTLLSELASLITLLLIGFFANNVVYSQSEFVLMWLLGALVSTIVAKFVFRSYKIVIRHTSFNDIMRFAFEVVGKEVLFVVFILLWSGFHRGLLIALGVDAMLTLCLLMSVRLIMISVYRYYFYRRKVEKKNRLASVAEEMPLSNSSLQSTGLIPVSFASALAASVCSWLGG